MQVEESTWMLDAPRRRRGSSFSATLKLPFLMLLLFFFFESPFLDPASTEKAPAVELDPPPGAFMDSSSFGLLDSLSCLDLVGALVKLFLSMMLSSWASTSSLTKSNNSSKFMVELFSFLVQVVVMAVGSFCKIIGIRNEE